MLQGFPGGGAEGDPYSQQSLRLRARDHGESPAPSPVPDCRSADLLPAAWVRSGQEDSSGGRLRGGACTAALSVVRLTWRGVLVDVELRARPDLDESWARRADARCPDYSRALCV